MFGNASQFEVALHVGADDDTDVAAFKKALAHVDAADLVEIRSDVSIEALSRKESYLDK